MSGFTVLSEASPPDMAEGSRFPAPFRAPQTQQDVDVNMGWFVQMLQDPSTMPDQMVDVFRGINTFVLRQYEAKQMLQEEVIALRKTFEQLELETKLTICIRLKEPAPLLPGVPTRKVDAYGNPTLYGRAWELVHQYGTGHLFVNGLAQQIVTFVLEDEILAAEAGRRALMLTKIGSLPLNEPLTDEKIGEMFKSVGLGSVYQQGQPQHPSIHQSIEQPNVGRCGGSRRRKRNRNSVSSVGTDSIALGPATNLTNLKNRNVNPRAPVSNTSLSRSQRQKKSRSATASTKKLTESEQRDKDSLTEQQEAFRRNIQCKDQAQRNEEEKWAREEQELLAKTIPNTRKRLYYGSPDIKMESDIEEGRRFFHNTNT